MSTSRYRRLGVLVGLTVVFMLSRRYPPTFGWGGTSYWLHGLAHAKYGNLDLDWMANTTSIHPIFDAIVSFTYRYVTLSISYVYLFIFYLVYVYSMLELGLGVSEPSAAGRPTVPTVKYVGLFCILLYAHWEWLWQFVRNAPYPIAGVANHWFLTPVFGVEVFGVLLVLSIVLHLKSRDYAAVVAACAAAVVNPTYLFAAACLTLAYAILALKRTRRFRKPAIICLLGLALTIPIVLYVTANFTASSPEIFRLAQDIIVKFRIPHHADPPSWFRWHSVALIAVVIWAIYVERRTSLAVVLGVPFVLGSAIGLFQFLHPSSALATIMPWRVSAFLVPISFCVLLGRAWRWLFDKYEERFERRRKLVYVAVALLVSIPMRRGILETREAVAGEGPEDAVLAHVKAHAVRGEQYLAPANLYTFRFETGAPIFVEEQAHPFHDTEVVEWFARLLLVDKIYGDAGRTPDGDRQPDDAEAVAAPDCELLGRVLRCGITHVVDVSNALLTACAGAKTYTLHKTYQDPVYSVLEVHWPGAVPQGSCSFADDPAMAQMSHNYRYQRLRIYGSYGLP